MKALIVLVSGLLAPCAFAVDWPQEIDAPEGTIVVYQPQPERLAGDVLSGRAAVALERQGSAEAAFGVFWFSARLVTDRDTGEVLIHRLKVTEVRWPDSEDASEARFTEIVEGIVPEAGFQISMERLTASLATAELERKNLEGLNNEPPKILFSEELAVLMLYDGEPRLVELDDTPYERALNVPFAVARHKQSKRVYVASGTFWYSATDPLGPFTVTTTPPADLVKMLPPPNAEQTKAAPPTPPKIVVATTPTELIVTQGAPSWKALPGGKLLYVENTESPWLRDAADQQMYVLLSGRWFRAKEPQGPWTFVRADQLPAAFKEIPPESEIGGLRVSVAGTLEAEDAIRDMQVPQTAAIKRSEAKLDVEYHGTPKFEPIAGTSVSYAVNTGAQVLQVEGRYYAVDKGVWFTAAAASGPWAVADKVPQEEIDKIPPSSPVYNVTYVEIYESTPEVVYVGYTPGYMWSFPYYGVPVYGSGWYYPPYWGGGFYYPYPPTWGFHVGYNPWMGWNYGMSWNYGFVAVGIGWGGGWGGAYRPWGCCGGGWYGGGYRPPHVTPYNGRVGIGNSVNAGNRAQVADRMNRGGVPTAGDRMAGGNNVYQRPEARARNADRATATRDLKQARPAANRRNDVMADKSGAVARRDGNQWQTHGQGGWQSGSGNRSGDRGTRPSTNPSIDRGDLDRGYDARQSGRSHEMSRPMGGGYRGGGGMRGR